MQQIRASRPCFGFVDSLTWFPISAESSYWREHSKSWLDAVADNWRSLLSAFCLICFYEWFFFFSWSFVPVFTMHISLDKYSKGLWRPPPQHFHLMSSVSWDDYGEQRDTRTLQSKQSRFIQEMGDGWDDYGEWWGTSSQACSQGIILVDIFYTKLIKGQADKVYSLLETGPLGKKSLVRFSSQHENFPPKNNR